MNANELADMIDSENWVPMDEQEHIEWEMKAATMLRQQQAEIEALKKAQMTPYAYAVVQGKDGRENVSLQFDHPEMCGQKYRQAIPLFTHPVKELTDEEIMECKAHVEVMYGCLPPLEFAWAILRKAQEK